MIAAIPFSGFYNTWHDGELDRTVEQMVSDDSGDQYDNLGEIASLDVEWRKVYAAYAAAYAEAFCDEFKIAGKFESMTSPREYNFTTDRIYIELEADEVARILAATSDCIMSDVCTKEFTSRSGFISYYSPDWRSWGPTEDWDHNQVYALLIAYAKEVHGSEFDMDAEFDLMEGYRCNGHMDDWVYANLGKQGKRAVKVADYLRSRAERKYRPFWAAQRELQAGA